MKTPKLFKSKTTFKGATIPEEGESVPVLKIKPGAPGRKLDLGNLPEGKWIDVTEADEAEVGDTLKKLLAPKSKKKAT